MGKQSDDFQSPVALLADFFRLGRKRSGRFTTAEFEERQAALFGYAYAVGRGIDSLVVRPGESAQRDSDAEFRWKEGATICQFPVQLKRLPPAAVNARETLDKIINKATLKCTGDDLLLAIQVDRAGQLKSLSVPKTLRVRELCLWGWSKPNHAELFVHRYVMGAVESRQWHVSFPPPGFQRV